MRNRFAGPCADCGLRVEVGQGHFERRRGYFVVRHIGCVAVARAKKAEAIQRLLSPDPVNPHAKEA